MSKPHEERRPLEVYAQRRADIATLLDRLNAALVDYDARAAADPQRWDYPGVLDYIRTGLLEAVEGVSGVTREQLEEELPQSTAMPASATQPEDRVYVRANAYLELLASDRLAMKLVLSPKFTSADGEQQFLVSREAAIYLRDALHREVRRVGPSDREEAADSYVEVDDGCPRCDERRTDYLTCSEDDAVRCDSCGHRYELRRPTE